MIYDHIGNFLVTAVKVDIFNFSSLADSSLLEGSDYTFHCGNSFPDGGLYWLMESYFIGGGPCAEASALKGLAWLTWFICTCISCQKSCNGTNTHHSVWILGGAWRLLRNQCQAGYR
jgi:hypothetical protein